MTDYFVVLVTLRTAAGEVHLVAVLEDRKKETVRNTIAPSLV